MLSGVLFLIFGHNFFPFPFVALVEVVVECCASVAHCFECLFCFVCGSGGGVIGGGRVGCIWS